MNTCPGNNYDDDLCMADFRRNQVFDYRNGFRVDRRDDPCLTVKDLFEVYNYDPTLTYGEPKRGPPPVVPAFVQLEKKVLRFIAYYKEGAHDSDVEIYRVRPVEIYYYLEDDSMMVQEPRVENSGLAQGKFLRRHRIPKNDIGETYHWKDLNIRMEIMLYGRVFRICDADCFTKNFYESEGIIFHDPEALPKDPYTDRRLNQLQRRHGTMNNNGRDVHHKFLTYGNKCLKLCCLWDNREEAFGGLRKMELSYYLADDTVEVREMEQSNHSSTLILHKTRLPKDWKDLPVNFPVICLEPTEREYVEYYGPSDFQIGATINVFGRRFLIYNMDEGTKQFYREHFGYSDFTPICVDQPKQVLQPPCPAPYNGWGSPEDSLQSYLNLVPVRPRYDAIKSLVFETKVLKFGAVMDSCRPEDQGRQFTISYRPADDTLCVHELAIRNNGYPGGKFLDFMRILKPGSSNDCPEYYGVGDLYIGAMVDFFGHRFCIHCADPFVLQFMNVNPCYFSDHVRQNLTEYFQCQRQSQPVKEEKPCDPGKPVCEEPLREGFFEFLGLGKQNIDRDPCSENPACYTMTCNGYNNQNQRNNCVGSNNPSPGNPLMFTSQEKAVCSTNQYLPPDCIPLQNPVLCEEPQCIHPDEYDYLKQHRFDYFNIPQTTDEELDRRQKRWQNYRPCCPQNGES